MNKLKLLKQRVSEPKAILLCILLLFLSLISYSYASIHILSIGDWPHDVLRTTYSATWIQTGWAPSLGLVPKDKLERFDFIIIDTSVKEYASQEPWKDTFSDYVEKGGVLVTIVSKDFFSTGKIIRETHLGTGELLEITGYPNAPYKSQAWHSSKHFWEELFKNHISHGKLLLIQFLKIMITILAFALVALIALWFSGKPKAAESASKFATGDNSYQGTKRKPRLPSFTKQYGKHILAILVLLAISVSIYSGWLEGLHQGRTPAFEEGLLDISTITYDVNYVHEYHSFPQVYDSRTYSQPMDVSYYMRTPTEILPVLFSLLLGLSPFGSATATFIFCTFLAMLITYYLVYKHTKNTWAGLFGAALYWSANSYLIVGMELGHIRFMLVIVLIPLVFCATDLAFAERKKIYVAGMVASAAFYLWLLGNNAVIAAICLASAIIAWLSIYGYKRHLIRAAVLFGIFVAGAIGYLSLASVGEEFSPLVSFTLSSFIWNETPNLLQALALNVAQTNRTNPAIMSVGVFYLYTLITFLPVTFATLALFTRRKYIVPFFIGILLILLATAFHGPLSRIFLHMPLVFRASGRTFLPTATFIFSFLAAIGFLGLFTHFRACLKSIKLKSTLPWVFSAGIICLVLFSSLPVWMSFARSWDIPKDIKQAYDSIPTGSRILLLPIYGNCSYGYSLSSPEQSYYRKDTSVGWTMLNLHEYEANKHHLKNAYAPPSPWEVPFMTKWYFDMINEKMTRWNDTIGATYLLNLTPDLQYLVVYKKIVPMPVLQQLNESNQLGKTYENETMAVYKRVNSIELPIMESDKAFFLYCGSYRYSLPSLAMLPDGQVPVLMGQTPWGLFGLEDTKDMNNLIITTQNTTLDDIATEYVIANAKNKILINLEDTIGVSDTAWVSGEFWQPSLGKSAIATTTSGVVHNVSFNVSAKGTYDIYIRTACNGSWRGKLRVFLDDENIGEGYFPQNLYGYRWFHVRTVDLPQGKHTLGLMNTEIQWIDVDAIAILNHREYGENFGKYRDELQEIISQHNYLGIYEAENSFANLSSASVSDNYTQSWKMYPSGGCVRGQSVELQPIVHICDPLKYATNKDSVASTEGNPTDELWSVPDNNDFAWTFADESTDRLHLTITGLTPNHYYGMEIGIWSGGARNGEFIKDDYHQSLQSSNVEPHQMNWIPIARQLKTDAQGSLTFTYVRGSDLSMPSSLDDLRLITVDAATIPIEAPVSGEYYVTVREKGGSDVSIDGQDVLPYQIQTSDKWDYRCYQTYLTEGKHMVGFSNYGEEPIWLDSIYVSNQPLSQLLSHKNPEITVTVENDGKYIVNSCSGQPRYVLLAKSYFPLWVAEDSSEQARQAYLANSFLTGFYVSGETYEICFR